MRPPPLPRRDSLWLRARSAARATQNCLAERGARLRSYGLQSLRSGRRISSPDQCPREHPPGSDRASSSLELSNSLVRAIRLGQDAAHDLVSQCIVGPERKHLGYLRLGRRERVGRTGHSTDRLRRPNSRPVPDRVKHPDCRDRWPGRAQNIRALAPYSLIERCQSLKKRSIELGFNARSARCASADVSSVPS